MENRPKEVRNDAVSIAKGIAIILMVMAHARCPLWGQYYINMFHMPLFFFFSGYCFKAVYLDEPKKFSIKRVKGIYWPYVKWSLIFLLFHNVFFYLNIYNDEYGFRGAVSHLYDVNEYIKHAISIITRMTDHEQLLGGYWFMHSLFFGSFIFFLTLLVCKKMNMPSVVGGGILMLCTMILLYIDKHVPYFGIGAKETLASFFMMAGYWYKEKDLYWEDFKPWLMIPVYAAIVAIGVEYWQCGMLQLTLNKTLPYAFTAIVGTIMMFSLSKKLLLHKLLKTSLVFVGNNTLTILTWHLLSFKLVSLLLIWIYSQPMERLAEFPVMEEYAYMGWWIIYLLIGVCLPISICIVNNNYKKSCF